MKKIKLSDLNSGIKKGFLLTLLVYIIIFLFKKIS